MRKRDKIVEVQKPTDDELYLAREKMGPLANYSEEHVLNTASALKKLKGNQDVTAFCFTGTQQVKMFAGYGDGLICYWEISSSQTKVTGQ